MRCARRESVDSAKLLASGPPVRARSRAARSCVALILAAAFLAPAGQAQGMDGRVEVRVLDPSGRGVPAAIELISRSPDFRASAVADLSGRAVLRRIPVGTFRLTATHEGFDPAETSVSVRSAVPRLAEIVLRVSAVRDQITVTSPAPLFEPYRPSQPARASRDALSGTLGTTLGRSTVDVVTTLPGWLLEANAVLHPRGSEYDTQYVIDGMPVYDNRSIAFAPAFENGEFESVSVYTAAIPAEFGRRLGGVIALDTRRAGSPGHRSSLSLQGGSYGTRIASLSHLYARGGTELSLRAYGGVTDRYLDPPSLQNFTNRGSSGAYAARVSRDVRGRDRISFSVRSGRTGFMVPNDLVQQSAGQRQDRRSSESVGQAHYQGAISSRALVSLRGMIRELTSELWSNELSTPVYVLQDRGFREGALVADVSLEGESHTFKVGGDARWTAIREAFAMAEPDELPVLDLDFRGREVSNEASFYLQDQFRAGNFAASVGIRFDHYRLLVSETATSPRLAASYYLAPAGLQLYASYDRVFQPPPVENLLLSSAAPGLGLEDVEGGIPVPASRADFFEVGARKPIGDVVRLDVKHFWRRFRNAIDDDVFLNTSVSFPITFESAEIGGTEVRLELPAWKRLSSTVSYSNLLGRAASPVTGGLFVEGGEAEELRDVVQEFPISQDQRNTVAALFRIGLHRRLWISAGVRYGSGLPVELEGDDDEGDDDDGEDAREAGLSADGDEEDELQPIAQEILDRVNFERGRVRPNLSVDVSIGSRIWVRGHRSAILRFDVRNVSDRLNVINFSGLFSGTALAPGRQATVQLRVEF